MAPAQPNVFVFNYANWVSYYPELSQVTEMQANGYFYRAQNQIDNTPQSIIPVCENGYSPRGVLLNLCTAHIAALNASFNGQAPNPLVGRINVATEGSVTVNTAYEVANASAQWFIQTKYGAECWEGLSPYRAARYLPPARNRLNPYFPGSVIVQRPF